MGAVQRVTSVPRVLVALPQLLRDPASGAARTATTIAEIVARAGFAVELIATTATEGYATLDREEWAGPDGVYADGIHRFESRGVRCAVLDDEGDAYDVLFDDALRRFRPDLVFTYGGSPRAIARRRRARAAGARVIFGLYNTAYRSLEWFDHVDLVITPSEFLSRYYRDAIGLDSVPLPTPLWPDDVLADRRAPARVTMVNPSLEKGALVFAAITAELGGRHPEIAVEVFPSRSSPSSFMQIAALAGFDLSSHPRLILHPTVAVPAAIYRHARVVVVPSLVEDAAPRVIAEALANGIPPIGSDRGGIPEMCAGGGFVLPLPRDLDARSIRIDPQVVMPWVRRIAELFGSVETWRAASERARDAGQRYLAPAVTACYVDAFERVLTRGATPRRGRR